MLEQYKTPIKIEEPEDDDQFEINVLLEILLNEQPSAPLDVKPDLSDEIDEDVPLSTVQKLRRAARQQQQSPDPPVQTSNFEQSPTVEQTSCNNTSFDFDPSPVLEQTPQKSPKKRCREHDVSVQCILCTVVFDDRTKCLLHLREKHADEVFPCTMDDCNLCYENPYELLRHQWHSHRSSVKIRPCMKGASVVVPPAPIINQENFFFCHICRQVFKVARYLRRHIRRMHTPKAELISIRSKSRPIRCFQCAHCTCSYAKKWRLEKHIQEHLNAPTRQVKVEYEGNDCPFCFQSFNRLASHIRNSHPNDMFKRSKSLVVPPVRIFICQVCKKVFKKRSYLANHKRRMHLFKSPAPLKVEHLPAIEECFQCAHCTKSYTRKGCLENHMLRRHLIAPIRQVVVKQEGNQICPFCNKSFSRLAAHIKNSHQDADEKWSPKKVKVEQEDDEGPSVVEQRNRLFFVCHICKQVFYRKEHMLSHMQSNHLPESAPMDNQVSQSDQQTTKCFRCTQCPKIFSSKMCLISHMVRRHLDNLKVVEPKAKNKNCPMLATHIKKTHPESSKRIKVEQEEPAVVVAKKPRLEPSTASKERKSYKCHFCEHELFSSTGMYFHERSKHQDQMIKCPHANCKSQSNSVAWMESHVRNQHAEVSCDFCRESFSHNSVLMEHIKVSHPCSYINCKSFFKHRAQMVKHMQSAHIADAPSTSAASEGHVACLACKMSFNSKALLDEHQAGGCNPLNHYCSLCNEVFTSRSRLTRHMTASHRPNNVWAGLWRGLLYQATGIKCNACRIFFRQQQDLIEHLAIAHSAGGSW